MRTNLVTTLICADCGRLLEMEPDLAPYNAERGQHEPTLPTGATLVTTRVRVKPCSECVGKLKGAARSFVGALRTLGVDSPAP